MEKWCDCQPQSVQSLGLGMPRMYDAGCPVHGYVATEIHRALKSEIATLTEQLSHKAELCEVHRAEARTLASSLAEQAIANSVLSGQLSMVRAASAGYIASTDTQIATLTATNKRLSEALEKVRAVCSYENMGSEDAAESALRIATAALSEVTRLSGEDQT